MIRFDSLPPEVMQAMCTPMHQILPPSSSSSHPGSLYLGSMTAAMDKDLLRHHKITHIIHVVDVPWLPMPEKEGFNGYKISVLDHEGEDLRPHLEAACCHIDKALRGGKNVLVHCQQGISRSASIVIAYLIRNHNMSYDAALALLKRKRACVKPNPGFIRALQEWEAFWKRPNPHRRFTS